MTRVLIVDDHPVFRDGLAGLLATLPEVEIVGSAGTAEEALTALRENAPDIVLMDINLPGASGVEATRRAAQLAPATAVLVITMVDDDDTVFAALAAGARGYVLKADGSAALVAGVRAVSDGRPYFSPGVRHPLRAIAEREPIRPPPRRLGGEAIRGQASLTPREREIAPLLVEGKTNWCVANILGISVKTVETHRAHIMLKLGCESIVELVHYAVRNLMVVP